MVFEQARQVFFKLAGAAEVRGAAAPSEVKSLSPSPVYSPGAREGTGKLPKSSSDDKVGTALSQSCLGEGNPCCQVNLMGICPLSSVTGSEFLKVS